MTGTLCRHGSNFTSDSGDDIMIEMPWRPIASLYYDERIITDPRRESAVSCSV